MTDFPLPASGPERFPLGTALLLSAGLHLAAVALIHPAPGSTGSHTVVISTRLQSTNPTRALASSPQEPRQPSPPRDARAIFPVPAIPPDKSPAPSVIATEPLHLPAATAVEPRPAATPSPSVAVLAAALTSAGGSRGADVPELAADAAMHPTPPRTQQEPANVGPTMAAPLPALPLGVDDTWYQARQVDVQARVIGRIAPAYPDAARRRSQEGTLRAMLKIDDLGRVQSVEVVEAQPPGVFEEAALEALRQARFRPAMKDGRPVRFQATLRVDFKLED